MNRERLRAGFERLLHLGRNVSSGTTGEAPVVDSGQTGAPATVQEEPLVIEEFDRVALEVVEVVSGIDLLRDGNFHRLSEETGWDRLRADQAHIEEVLKIHDKIGGIKFPPDNGLGEWVGENGKSRFRVEVIKAQIRVPFLGYCEFGRVIMKHGWGVLEHQLEHQLELLRLNDISCLTVSSRIPAIDAQRYSESRKTQIDDQSSALYTGGVFGMLLGTAPVSASIDPGCQQTTQTFLAANGDFLLKPLGRQVNDIVLLQNRIKLRLTAP